MKKIIIPIIIIVICSIVFVITMSITPLKRYAINKDYIEQNYEIDLYQEDRNNSLNLYGEAKYIGNDTIIEEPTINLEITCNYVYFEDDTEKIDTIKNKIILNKNGKMHFGKTSIQLNHTEASDYRCLYKISNVTGFYAK